MPLALMMSAMVLAAYIACFRPNWFLAMLICIPVVLGIFVPLLGGDALTIKLGPLFIRPIDPCAIGLLIGVAYHARSGGLRKLRRQPGGTVLLLIIGFLAIKILATVAFGASNIESNSISNSFGGGLIAAVGEARDDLLAFVVPLYFIVSSRHLKLSRMALPFLVTIITILVSALLQIAYTGQIWSNTGEFRFIDSSAAIALTLLSFTIFFLPVAASRRRLYRSIACVAFAVSIVANHRSVWLASIFGVGVLVLLIMVGKLTVMRDRQTRLLWVVALPVLVAMGVASVYYAKDSGSGADSAGIGKRMLALTDPDRDSNADWRMNLWRARIEQSNEHWIGGRFLGDRQLTLVKGEWIGLPDHNAYVTGYELGGISLLGLEIALWGALAVEAFKRTRAGGPSSATWAPAVALAVVAASMAFGTAYDFPLIGPALATTLLLRKPKQALSIYRFTRYSEVPAMPIIRPEAFRARGA